ncbi:hypothetical protein [Adhaeribacter pallidiroseus]|uniref:Uncharacterized protein n=1 Tax=Adhaeribacter pallidiroseus TaxID=2072847 RepID=A0A369QPN8_9BACT|nr:hypothetical protein [Adhaeribacter pallidiroseus]RDC66282.1 hypothetical protein AHMF7616_04913 [Adhaeribacter pallidiroseus]
MQPNTNRSRNNPEKYLKYFTLFMCLVYPVLGLFIMLSDNTQIALSQNYKTILGTMLMAYGVLRFYRAYKKYFPKEYPDENS